MAKEIWHTISLDIDVISCKVIMIQVSFGLCPLKSEPSVWVKPSHCHRTSNYNCLIIRFNAISTAWHYYIHEKLLWRRHCIIFKIKISVKEFSFCYKYWILNELSSLSMYIYSIPKSYTWKSLIVTRYLYKIPLILAMF